MFTSHECTVELKCVEQYIDPQCSQPPTSIAAAREHSGMAQSKNRKTAISRRSFEI